MKSEFTLITACVLLFVAVISLAQAEDAAKPSPAAEVKKAVEAAAAAPAAPAAKAKQTPIALTLEGIQELEDRKVALDAREKQLEERARDLEIQEKLLKEKLKKMESLNQRMAERLDVFKKDHEGRIGKLVTVVEGMKPEMAARYVEALDAYLAVEILSRIQTQKASKILNLVDKQKSARLTELYTGYRSTIEELPAPVAAPQSAKEAAPANKPM